MSLAAMAGAVISSVDTEIIPDRGNPQLLVHITTADGARGVGETWWGTYQPDAQPGSPVRPIASMIDHVLGPECIGLDSLDVAAVWAHLHRAGYQYGPEGITSCAIAGIDLALWDLNGRRAGVPVAELLGPKVHDSLPAYASLHWMGDVEQACREARRAIDFGFVGVKLHEIDAGLVHAVRDAIGPNVALMLDASARLDDQGTSELAAAVEADDLTWIEEPIFPQQDHARMARLRTSISQRLAAGENEFSVAGFRRLIPAVDVLQPDLAKCGGLSTAGQLAELAEENDIWLCPHNFSLGPSLGANIHWAMTARATKWIEIPFLPLGESFAGPFETPELIDGQILYPNGPGLAWL